MLAPPGLAPFIVIAVALEPASLPAEPSADAIAEMDMPAACPEEADPSIAAEDWEAARACSPELLEAGLEQVGFGDPGFADLALTGAWLGDPGRAGGELDAFGLGAPVSPWRARIARWLPSLGIGVVHRRDQDGRSAELWLRLSWTLEDS